MPTFHSRTYLLLSALLILCVPPTAARDKTPGDIPARYALHPKPADHLLGDVHPFFPSSDKGGECYLYYLKPGGYNSALLRSSDLLLWTEQPMTHAPTRPADWFSPYYVLGVLREPSGPTQPPLYRSFFGHKEGRIASSTSTDLIHWSSAPQDISIPPADYYQRRRDPFVFWMPATRQFGCVMTTWMKGRPKETCGAVSLATSPNLKTWKDHGPIMDPGTIGEPECPQMFQLPGSDRWYLLASIYDRAVGHPVYWTADTPLGLWSKAPAGQLDGKDLCAAQIAFDGDTPILFGWIPLHPARPGKQTWGGHLALPREVYALPDKTLATRLSARVAKPLNHLKWQVLSDITLASQPGLIEGPFPAFALEFTATLPKAAQEVGLQFASLGQVLIRRHRLSILGNSGESWAELPLSSPLLTDHPFTVRLFIDHDIVELFVNDRYSLAARLPPATAAPNTLSIHGDGAQITSLRLSSLNLH